MNTRGRIRNAPLIALIMIGIPSAVLLGARPQVREGRRKGPVMTSTIAFVSTLPGAAAADSDIFILSVDDFLKKKA